MRWWFWSCVILGSLASLGLYWLTDVPLGVPGEWIWGRHDATPDLLANLIVGGGAGALYLAFVAWGARRLVRPQCGRLQSCAWLGGLAVVGAVWIVAAEGTGTSGSTVGRWPLILYYPGPSGYFERARYKSPDAKEFLRGYEALMQEGDVLHTGTHPPGLFLFFHGVICIAERSPALTSAAIATQPSVIHETLDIIDGEVRASISRGDVSKLPLTPVDRAVIWVAGLVCLSLAAATVWPLYGFLRLDFDRPTSWLIAAAWPLVPAIGIFLPKSDVAFAFIAMLTACLWRRAWRQSNIGLAMLASGVWTIGILCSLAFLPVALWLALLSLFDSWPAIRGGQARQELLRGARTILPAGLIFLAIMAFFAWQGEIAIWNVYWWNYHNHAGFYRQFPRTYLAWLAVNPLELMLAAGAPLYVAACFGIGSELRRWRTGAHLSGATGDGFDSPVLSTHQKHEDTLAAQSGRQWHPVISPLFSPCLATLIVWGWLWLSGKNSGEAARLWTFLLPFVVICAAAWWSSMKDTRRERSYFGWLIFQAAVCLLTVQRVNGFPL